MPPSAKAAPRKPKKASGHQKDSEGIKSSSLVVPPANSDLLPGRLAPFDEKSFKERCASEGNKSSSSVTYGGNLLWIDPLCVSPTVPVMDARVKDLKDYWKKPESPDIVFDISVSWSVNSEKPPYGKMTLVSPTEPLDQIAVGIATTIATATTR